MMLSALTSLAYRPFLEPLPIDDVWMWLLLPMAVFVSLVWKTIRLGDVRDIPRHTAMMTSQIIIFFAIAAAVIWFIVELE